MTDWAAGQEAMRLFGAGGIVWRDDLLREPYCVGIASTPAPILLGQGRTWEEAFASVKPEMISGAVSRSPNPTAPLQRERKVKMPPQPPHKPAPAPHPWLPKKPEHHKFKTGAKPTPRWKLARAKPFNPGPRGGKNRPIVVPATLEMWLNDQIGDCVSAEECAAIAFYSTMLGLPEIQISDSVLQAWVDQYGYANGAELTDVMDTMISTGITQGTTYKDGPYTAVDYSTESVLQAAIELGPVKIGIDSQALPSGAGNGNGWYASGGTPGQFSAEDHCVGVWNYGPSSELFAALNTPVPSGFPSTGYHVFTWSSVGVVDHPWIMSTCAEAWLRSPTDVSFAQPGQVGAMTFQQFLQALIALLGELFPSGREADLATAAQAYLALRSAQGR